MLSAQEQRLAYDALFWPGAPPDLEQARGFLQKLKVERLERRRGKLRLEIDAAVQSKDSTRLMELQRAKISLDKELRQMARPQKIAQVQTN
jgi:hypothetical protein